MEILIKRINEKAVLPSYSKEAGPGIDLCSVEDMSLAPGEVAIVKTGVAMAMPVGYVGFIWNKHSIVVGETLRVTSGLVDSGYRQEIKIEVVNYGEEAYEIGAGDIIAQLVIQQVQHAHLIEAEDLGTSA